MQLFVNGDSHTAEVYDTHGITATELLAQQLGLGYQNIALPGGSNQRIIRTTLEQLPHLDPMNTVLIIGWSGFERTEWYFQNKWHQICGDPYYVVDDSLRNLWINHVAAWESNEQDRWRRTQDQHQAIWVFHNLLHSLGYKFIFYQGTKMSFFDGCLYDNKSYRLPWIDQTWVHDPYVSLKDSSLPVTDSNILRDSFSWYVESRGCKQSDNRAHYGADAHVIWADYLRPHLKLKLDQLTKE